MWVIFSILAALCWASVNIVDKYVLTNWIRKPPTLLIIYGTVGLIACLIVYFTLGFSYLTTFNIFLAFIAGICHILMTLFYFKAVKIEEISRVAPLFYLTPLFILIFAGIFLDEVFAPMKYLGIFLLVIGAILISSRTFSKISFSKAFGLMILSVVALSANQILTKYLLDFADWWTIFAYTRMGAAIGVIPIVYIYFPELINTIKTHGKRVIAILPGVESLNLLGVLFITIAASVGYVTLVNALSSIQPIFVLLFVVILSIFYPSILKEELGKSVIFQKIVAIILMFIGAILIT